MPRVNPGRGVLAPGPVAVVGLGDAAQIAVGFNHACARRRDGTVACWGRNLRGPLGDGTAFSEDAPVPVVGLVHATDIFAGIAHTCAATDVGVSCWGFNAFGQLGDGTTLDRLTPVVVPGLPPGTRIAAGNLHTCALLPDGTVQCWGDNEGGQLGDGSSASMRPTPGAVPGLRDVVRLAAGDEFTCAQMADGTLQCWGTRVGRRVARSDAIARAGRRSHPDLRCREQRVLRRAERPLAGLYIGQRCSDAGRVLRSEATVSWPIDGTTSARSRQRTKRSQLLSATTRQPARAARRAGDRGRVTRGRRASAPRAR